MTASSGPAPVVVPIGSSSVAAPSIRSTVVDLVAILVLGGCGLVGFRSIYGGTGWAVVGSVGLVVGIVIGVVGSRRRWDTLVLSAVTVVAYFLLSGVALPDRAAAGLLPSLASLRGAADGAVVGWAELLTTRPPVGNSGVALVVPLLCLLVGSVVSSSLSLRTERLVSPLAPMWSVVVVSILFGIAEPAHLVLQGAVLMLVSIAWVAFRRRGSRSSVVSTAGTGRLVGAVLMLGLAAVSSLTLGSRMPGVDADSRLILRDLADPPFDPRAYPSPLAGFRHYTDDRNDNLRDKVVFTVSGMPAGEPLRLAVLDTWDGVVWNVSGGASAGGTDSGVFRRVGDRLPVDSDGDQAKVTIKIGEYRDIWLPTLGDVAGMSFGGPRGGELADSLRFNETTDSGAVPVGLRSGDRVTINAVVSKPPSRLELEGRPAGTSVVGGAVQPPPDDLKELADRFLAPVADAEPPAPGYDQVAALSDGFVNGQQFGFSDGLASSAPSRPGHHVGRLNQLAGDAVSSLAYGNGEQYAAALGVLSAALRVPTRVVMGFCETGCPGQNIELTGDKVAAWVEINIDGFGWVRVPATPDPDKQLQAQKPDPKPRPEDASQPPPPPVTTPPPEELVANDEDRRKKKSDADSPILSGTQLAVIAFAGTPVALVAGLVSSVLILKRRRRTRRRSMGPARDRVIGGWDEVADFALDLGRPLPAVATRREAANLLGDVNVRQAAWMADLAIFGPHQPIESDIEVYWDTVEASSESLLVGLGRVARAKVAVNPTSLVRRWRLSRVARRRSPSPERVAVGQSVGRDDREQVSL